MNSLFATASAVRWSTSVYFLLASAALWIYARMTSGKPTAEADEADSADSKTADLWRWFGVFTTVTSLPLASMLLAVVWMCFLIRGSNLAMQLWSTSLLAIGLVLGAVLVGSGTNGQPLSNRARRSLAKNADGGGSFGRVAGHADDCHVCLPVGSNIGFASDHGTESRQRFCEHGYQPVVHHSHVAAGGEFVETPFVCEVPN
ncbi:MAG: hypothetical protein R3C28_12590 [Pirellulaceae bacterium]